MSNLDITVSVDGIDKVEGLIANHRKILDDLYENITEMSKAIAIVNLQIKSPSAATDELNV